MDITVPFPKPKIYELIGAMIAGAGVYIGAILGTPTGVLDPTAAILAVVSFGAGGAFVGHYIRKVAERRTAEKLLRQYLWNANCSLNSSPLEFVRLASRRVVASAPATKIQTKLPGDEEAALHGWANGLSEVAAVVAYALDPNDRRRDIAADPGNWERYREVADWVIPLMNSCGISHKFKAPAEDPSVVDRVIESAGVASDSSEAIDHRDTSDASAKEIGR